MIKSENGVVELNGDTVEIMADLTSAIMGMRKAFEKKEGKENADKFIKKAIEIGLMNNEEIAAETEKALKQFERGLMATLAKAMLFDD